MKQLVSLFPTTVEPKFCCIVICFIIVCHLEPLLSPTCSVRIYPKVSWKNTETLTVPWHDVWVGCLAIGFFIIHHPCVFLAQHIIGAGCLRSIRTVLGLTSFIWAWPEFCFSLAEIGFGRFAKNHKIRTPKVLSVPRLFFGIWWCSNQVTSSNLMETVLLVSVVYLDNNGWIPSLRPKKGFDTELWKNHRLVEKIGPLQK